MYNDIHVLLYIICVLLHKLPEIGSILLAGYLRVLYYYIYIFKVHVYTMYVFSS